jgi:hypothetical protein
MRLHPAQGPPSVRLTFCQQPQKQRKKKQLDTRLFILLFGGNATAFYAFKVSAKNSSF